MKTGVKTKNLECAVADLTHDIGLLIRKMRAAAHSHELTLTESAVLGRLTRDGPATTAALARAEGISPQSMGATLASLEGMGLVARRPHPTDGRQVLIHITDRGDTLRRSVVEAKRNWLTQAIARLDDRDRETLFEASKIMRKLAENDR
jgi:DNA-binding MarR family transcriptional regulator